MGGSSVGGRLASAVLGPQLSRPFALAMGYDIPAWIGSETLVLCSSYSGTPRRRRRPTTRPSRPARRGSSPPPAARSPSAPAPTACRSSRCPGGFQPRAAVGYSLVTALEAAALAGAAPSVRDDVARPPALVRELAPEWGPTGDEDSEAKRLARALRGAIPSSPAPA